VVASAVHLLLLLVLCTDTLRYAAAVGPNNKHQLYFEVSPDQLLVSASSAKPPPQVLLQCCCQQRAAGQ
jgi:hypothetical protein